MPGVDLVEALGDHYASERAGPDDVVWMGFFGGPPPDDALIAAGGRPFVARVRPDLLSRADARRLAEAGAVGIELDALSLDDHVLRQSGRRYSGALVLEILRGLARYDVRIGVVLAPGLPGSSFDSCVDDARRVAPLVDTARLHPVLVLEHARLQAHHIDGRYRPLEVGEAVTVSRAMMDVLEDAGVQVIRVGLQPGPDGFGRALAGPRHSSLRQLVEARRTRDRLFAMLDGTPAGSHIVIRCAPRDETRTRGPFNQHVRDLRARFSLSAVEIRPDPALSRGEWALDLQEGT